MASIYHGAQIKLTTIISSSFPCLVFYFRQEDAADFVDDSHYITMLIHFAEHFLTTSRIQPRLVYSFDPEMYVMGHQQLVNETQGGRAVQTQQASVIPILLPVRGSGSGRSNAYLFVDHDRQYLHLTFSHPYLHISILSTAVMNHLYDSE